MNRRAFLEALAATGAVPVAESAAADGGGEASAPGVRRIEPRRPGWASIEFEEEAAAELSIDGHIDSYGADASAAVSVLVKTGAVWASVELDPEEAREAAAELLAVTELAESAAASERADK